MCKINPFIGVFTYSEADADKYYGRYEEKLAIAERIKNNSITIIYGKSGIGKSSLINAGIIPILKEKDNESSIKYIPITVKLSYDKDYVEQVNYELKKENISDSQIPIVILDQFEDVYKPDSEVKKKE